MPSASTASVSAGFLFDVYGTVVDWFTPLRNAVAKLAEQNGARIDADQFARDWRNGYARATAARAAANLPRVPLSELTRAQLNELVSERFSSAVPAADLEQTNAVWRTLEPWPDTVAGLTALKRVGPIGTCSNGSLEDMEPLARHARLPWDHYLGSEASGYFKPHADTYLKSVEGLGVRPDQAVMVACHQKDLVRAVELGMQTAFVVRPMEFGGAGCGEEIKPTGDWDYVASDFLDLARQVGSKSRFARPG